MCISIYIYDSVLNIYTYMHVYTHVYIYMHKEQCVTPRPLAVHLADKMLKEAGATASRTWTWMAQ